MVESEEDFILRGFNTNPLILSKLYKSEPNKLNALFPYSVGMEVETHLLKSVDYNDARKDFDNLSLMALDINRGDEQRFRFKAGFEGAVELYKTTRLFYKYLAFNTASGIHYHIDFTDVWNEINLDDLLEQEEWVLPELDKWDYKGSYNSRGLSDGSHTWARWNREHKTLEFRLGNMEFDYQKIIQCVLSAQMISAKLKVVLRRFDKNLRELQQKLVSLKSEPESEPKENWEEVIKSRVTKIN